jgi:hypothetical protein
MWFLPCRLPRVKLSVPATSRVVDLSLSNSNSNSNIIAQHPPRWPLQTKAPRPRLFVVSHRPQLPPVSTVVDLGRNHFIAPGTRREPIYPEDLTLPAITCHGSGQIGC